MSTARRSSCQSYPAEFRRKALDLIEAGRPVAEVAEQFDVTGQTIYNWRNRDLIDRGIEPGVSTAESVALAAARRRTRELELTVTRRALELLKEHTHPRGASRSSRPREHGCDYAEQAPVVIGEVRATDLSSQHAEPVAQDDDLEVLAAA